MTKVSFADYNFQFKNEQGLKQIFDPVRKKYIALTPEEWVRQHIIHYLLALGYSPALIAVERGITVNGSQKRFDIVVFGQDSKPLIIVECKAEGEPLNHAVMMQVAGYNLSLQAQYFWLSNGAQNYFVRLHDGVVMDSIPKFKSL